jgi:hypothetical protein
MRLLAIAIALAGVLTACALPSSRETDELATGKPGDSHTLTERDLAAGGPRNLLNAVRDLRPRWLETSAAPFSTVTVFIGNSRAGGARSLDGIETSSVREVRYFDTSAAQQRFSGPVGPVIQILLK